MPIESILSFFKKKKDVEETKSVVTRPATREELLAQIKAAIAGGNADIACHYAGNGKHYIRDDQSPVFYDDDHSAFFVPDQIKGIIDELGYELTGTHWVVENFNTPLCLSHYPQHMQQGVIDNVEARHVTTEVVDQSMLKFAGHLVAVGKCKNLAIVQGGVVFQQDNIEKITSNNVKLSLNYPGTIEHEVKVGIRPKNTGGICQFSPAQNVAIVQPMAALTYKVVKAIRKKFKDKKILKSRLFRAEGFVNLMYDFDDGSFLVISSAQLFTACEPKDAPDVYSIVKFLTTKVSPDTGGKLLDMKIDGCRVTWVANKLEVLHMDGE